MNYVYVFLLLAFGNTWGMQQLTNTDFSAKESANNHDVVFKKPLWPSTKRVKKLALHKPVVQEANKPQRDYKKLHALSKYLHKSDAWLDELFYRVYLPLWRENTSPLKNLTNDKLLGAFKGLVAQERAKKKILETKPVLN